MRSKRRIDWYLVAILVLAAFLYVWGIWDAGSANSYYTAAVTSMVKSWKNFWYGAFDPAGFITVDKPPVALWFMAISAKIFGVHGWSVILPSVLFGIGSVYLIYKMIQPYFGDWSARLAALAMTLTPIVVADSRTNNMDATLVFFLLLAGYILQQAIVKKSNWRVLVSFALIGVAFNVKMLQAFMLLPAMYIFYWLAVKKPWKRKLGLLISATVALAIFTLAWPLAVDLTPASQRPYIGSSQHNSVLELAFGYNGTERLLGQSTGTGGAFPGMNSKTNKNGAPNNLKKPSGTQAPNGTNAPGSSANGESLKPANMPEGLGNGGGPGGNQKGSGMGAGGGIFNIGTAGPLRLFQTALGPQISWLLPFAIIGLIGSYWAFRRRKNKWYQTTNRQNQLWYWAMWLVPVGGFFSVASFFHPYYTIMLAPPIAALFGISLPVLWKYFKQGLWKTWTTYLLPIAFAITMALQIFYVWSYYIWGSMILLGLTLVGLIMLFATKKKPSGKWVIHFITCVLLLTPGLWSLTPTLAEESAAVPTSGPDLLNTQSGAGGMMDTKVNTKLLNYLEKHESSSTKYLFATTDSNSASAYVIKTGRAVMAIGGYNGTDPAITLKQFKALVKKGEIKYFYISGKSSNSAIVKWVKKYGSKVKAVSSSTTSAQNGETQAVSGSSVAVKESSGSTSNSQPTPPSGSTSPQGNGNAPSGTPPTGAPGNTPPTGMKRPSGTAKKPSASSKKNTSSSSTKQNTAQNAPGGMSGMGESGTLYKLTASDASK